MYKKLPGMVEQEVSKQLAFLKDHSGAISAPVGYNPIDKIRGGLFHWISVPFNDVEIWCQLRCLNATQIEQCGNISTLNITDETKELSYDDIIKIRNYQENLCKMSMNIPTFDEIHSMVLGEDFVLKEKREQAEALRKRFEENKKDMTETDKHTLEIELRTIELMIGYVLPDNTMAFITRWAMGNDISDVKRLSKETLLRAAYLAKAHNKAPSDYISGIYTDYNRNEIDVCAFNLLDDHIKTAQAVKGKFTWLLGGRHVASKVSSLLPKRKGK